MESDNTVAAWESPELGSLLACAANIPPEHLKSHVQSALHTPPNAAGCHVFSSQHKSSMADTLVLAMDSSFSIVVGRPRVPATLSPIIWMKHRANEYVAGNPRETHLLIRNALLRRRYLLRWNIRLLNIPTMLSVYSNFTHDKATPQERLRVLPKVLHEIVEGRLRVCYIAHEPEIENHRFGTYGNDWAIELLLKPDTNTIIREFFEVSESRLHLNESLIAQVGKRYFGNSILTPHFLDDLHTTTAFKISKDTISLFLDHLEAKWKNGGQPGVAMDTLAEVRDAVKNEREYAGEPFDLPGELFGNQACANALRQYLQQALHTIGVQLDLNASGPPAYKRTMPEVDQADKEVLWRGTKLDIGKGVQYKILVKLIDNYGSVVPRDEMLELVGRSRKDGGKGALSEARSRIARELKRVGCPYQIRGDAYFELRHRAD